MWGLGGEGRRSHVKRTQPEPPAGTRGRSISSFQDPSLWRRERRRLSKENTVEAGVGPTRGSCPRRTGRGSLGLPKPRVPRWPGQAVEKAGGPSHTAAGAGEPGGPQSRAWRCTWPGSTSVAGCLWRLRPLGELLCLTVGMHALVSCATRAPLQSVHFSHPSCPSPGQVSTVPARAPPPPPHWSTVGTW